jgi:LacI family transcriptional regulator
MTLKELAKELNLSISAVSKALRDSHEISAKTKELVLAKAKELNYQVNPIASSLRKQKSKTIGVVIPEIANNFFSLAINGIESIAAERGYHVLIYLTHEDMEKEVAITKLLQHGRVDGIILSMSSNTSDTAHLTELKNKEIPLVLFDRIAENIMCPKVTTDDFQSGFKATKHLISRQCHDIAFLYISNRLSISNRRQSGYMDALLKNGIKVDNDLIIECEHDHENNKKIIRNLLTRKNRPQAIFGSVEKLILTTYEVCNELGLKIPQDLKVVGFSNSPMAGLLNPSLTTITQPAYEIGNKAASILFELVEKRMLNKLMPETTTLNAEFIIRNSTASI